MWRTQAVVSTLVEDVAGLRRSDGEPVHRQALADLKRAQRRALWIVTFDWAVLLILLLLRSQAQPFLTLGPTIDTVFSLGVLAVAVHSGFRLGQLEKLKSVARVCGELLDRDPEG